MRLFRPIGRVRKRSVSIKERNAAWGKWMRWNSIGGKEFVGADSNGCKLCEGTNSMRTREQIAIERRCRLKHISPMQMLLKHFQFSIQALRRTYSRPLRLFFSFSCSRKGLREGEMRSLNERSKWETKKRERPKRSYSPSYYSAFTFLSHSLSHSLSLFIHFPRALPLIPLPIHFPHFPSLQRPPATAWTSHWDANSQQTCATKRRAINAQDSDEWLAVAGEFRSKTLQWLHGVRVRNFECEL